MIDPKRDNILLLLTLKEIVDLCMVRGLEIQGGREADPIVQAIFSAAEAAIDGREIHVGYPQEGEKDGVEAERVTSDSDSAHDTRPVDIRSRRPIKEEQSTGEQLPISGEGEQRIPDSSGDVLPSGEGTREDGEGGDDGGAS